MSTLSLVVVFIAFTFNAIHALPGTNTERRWTEDRKTSAIPSSWESPLFRMKRNMLRSAVLEYCGVLRLVKELREVGKILPYLQRVWSW